MKSNKVFFNFVCACAVGILFNGCMQTPKLSSNNGESFTCTPGPTTNVVSSQAPTGANVMTVTVNGSQCTNGGAYQNEPCVSVTICSPGTSTCQTIDNILLDTGSYGLRIFSSLITVPLTPVTVGSGTLAECVQFGDGSSEWGPVETAGVQLGGETAVNVSIEVVNSTYATPPGPCTASQGSPDSNPQEAGFNGILGVGLMTQDCGTVCAQASNNGQYYVCTGSTCTASSAQVAQQVVNPVSVLPKDNNGVILELPSVSPNGQASDSGWLVLGIGTETNNQPANVTAYSADQYATFTTDWDVNQMTSFIDSGSNFLYFPSPQSGVLYDCGGNNKGLFCPGASTNLTAANIAANGQTTSCVGFQIANADQLLSGGGKVFSNVGANSGTGNQELFDWGLPFFFGKNVYVGFEGTSSSLGTGPYWAY